MRKLLITISDNRIVASNDFLGYQGEHNATKLIFELPEELKSDDYNYSVNVTLPDGITASTPLTNLELTVTSTLTVNSGVLQLQLVITKDKELIYKSGTVNLTIKKSIIPNAVIGGGSGVVSAVVDEEGYLIFTLTDGTTQNAGLVKGEKGEQGEQGNSYTLTESDKQEVASKMSADIIKGLIEHNIVAFEIPEGTVKIADYKFQNNIDLRRVAIPDTLEEIGLSAFEGCFKLTGFERMGAVKVIKENAFKKCYSLTDVDFLECVETIGRTAFEECYSLTEARLTNCLVVGYGAFSAVFNIRRLLLPNCKTIDILAFSGCQNLSYVDISSVEAIGQRCFSGCTRLETVVLGIDFNCNGLDVSSSSIFSAEALVDMLNSLKDRTSDTAYTLTLGSTNLAKLTDEQKAIATNKNWVLK